MRTYSLLVYLVIVLATSMLACGGGDPFMQDKDEKNVSETIPAPGQRN